MVRKKRALFQSEIINFLFRLIPTFVGALGYNKILILSLKSTTLQDI